MGNKEDIHAPDPQPASGPKLAQRQPPKPAFALGIVLMVAVIFIACYFLIRSSLPQKGTVDRQMDDALRE